MSLSPSEGKTKSAGRIQQLSKEAVQQIFQQCVEKAKAHVKNQEWVQAIEYYQKAIKLQPRKQAWIYLSLGSLLVKQGLVDEAIDCYKIANELRPENAQTYALMGVALGKKGERDRAIASYRKAISLDAAQPVWVQKKLGDALSERALEDLKETAFRYAQVMCRRDRFSHFDLLVKTIEKIFGSFGECTEKNIYVMFEDFSDRDAETFNFLMRLARLGFLNPKGSPVNLAGYYVINEQLKAVYCSIPKNACTLFKTMMVKHSDLKNAYETSGENIHTFLSQRMKNVSALHLLNCLDSEEYFKFVIIRNPFDRIVSAYLDKFAKHKFPEPFVQEVISSVRRFLCLEPSTEMSITFEQFVDYVAYTPDNKLNDHWRPQTNFLASVRFDFVGQFEFMDASIEFLEQKFNIEIFEDVATHATQYHCFENHQDFHRLYPHQLRSLVGMPDSSSIYTKELNRRVCLRFLRDVMFIKKNFDFVL